MKNVLIVFLVLFILFSLNLYSQKIGVSTGLNIPANNEFSEGVKFGNEVGVMLSAPIFGLDAVIYGGYGFWQEESFEEFEVNYSNFPIILVGARKYFGKFYASALAGTYPVKLTLTKGGEENEASETQFSFKPGLGIVVPVSFANIDFSLNYLLNSDFSHLSLNLGMFL